MATIQTPRLDDEQLAAVRAVKGPVQIDACAGAGKTTCLVDHIDHLLNDCRVPEKDIVAFTFTKNAANEMRIRSGLARETLRTIHSWALSVVKHEVSNFTPPLRPNPLLLNQYEILRPIIKRRGVDYKETIAYISKCKRRGLSPAAALDEIRSDDDLEVFTDLALAYRDYEAECRHIGVLDFDSIIIELVNLFEARPDICERHQIRFLLIDEAQDCAEIDWALIKLISKKHRNVWAVGDVNQCVYEFRGANPDLFAKFPEMFPGARVFPISTNYRSSETIVEYSKQVAPQKTSYIEKLRAHKKGGVPNSYTQYVTDEEESKQILDLIQRGLAITETAILARTNAQLGLVQGMCSARQIPYVLLGKGNFWKKPEVLGLLAFAKHTQHQDDDTTRACIRAPFECNKFLHKDSAIEELAETAEVSNCSFYQAMPHHSKEIVRRLHGMLGDLKRLSGSNNPRDFMWKMAEVTGALDLAESKENEESDSFVEENIRKVLGISGMFRTMPEFLNFANTAGRSSNKKARLILSTVHGFKGMQARNVFVIGVNDGVFPHIKSPLVEEQRLYYVAITRPCERLFVSCCADPSKFILNELPAKCDKPPAAPEPWAAFQLMPRGAR